MTDEIQSRINSYLRQISNRNSAIEDMKEQNRSDKKTIAALMRLSKRRVLLVNKETGQCQ